MPEVSPKFSFWLGVCVTVFVAVGSGAVNLTDAIPDAWIPTVKAWNNLAGLAGTALLTALHGMSANRPGPLTK